MAPSREIDSFECTACGATLENWDTAWVPIYRLIAEPAIVIAEPAIKPDEPADTPEQTGERGAIAPDRP
jgi:hypothetical protein